MSASTERSFLPFALPTVEEDDIQGVVETLQSGWLTTGPRAKEFERQFAEFVGVKHAIAVNSATAGLHLALDAIGLRPGEEVLVPTMTFAATAEVVRYFEARPVLLDVDAHSFNLTPAIVEAWLEAHCDPGKGEAINRETGARVRAVMPVHYAGLPCDMPGFVAVAEKYGLLIVEDAAHTLPASIHGRSVGTYGSIAAFSFYANKNITTGEGGMIVTNDDEMADRARIMSLHGISRDAWKRFTAEGSWYYEIIAPGFKYNLTDIAASLGLSQLKKAERFLAAREAYARRYTEAFADTPEVRTPAFPEEGVVHSWHLYVIRVDEDALTIDRGEFINQLRARGIGTSVHYTPLHMHPYYRKEYGYQPEDLPVAAAEYRGIITLPLYPRMTTEDVDRVIEAVKEIVRENRR